MLEHIDLQLPTSGRYPQNCSREHLKFSSCWSVTQTAPFESRQKDESNIQLSQCQHVVLLARCRSNFDSGNLERLKLLEKGLGVLWQTENQETTRRLRIKKDVFHLR